MKGKKAILATLAAGVLLAVGCPGAPHHPELAQSGTSDTPGSTAAFETTINRPYQQLGVTTAQRDINGKPARVPCGVCHARLEAGEDAAAIEHVAGFHGGVELRHGDATCATCHRGPLYEDFRLAGGSTVSYADVMQLCAQCHGSVDRDYKQGAHGGMTGYWDLSSGPRLRNHCLDCHGAHVPQIPTMQPAELPRYRFVRMEMPHE